MFFYFYSISYENIAKHGMYRCWKNSTNSTLTNLNDTG